MPRRSTFYIDATMDNVNDNMNKIWCGTVIGRCEPKKGYYCLTVKAPHVALSARAGQFIHVLPRTSESNDPLLRRAFSIMQAKNEQIDILFRVGGPGTRLLAQKNIGEEVDFLGPLGLPFAQMDLTLSNSTVIMVGGGIGVPPMVMLGRQLSDENPTRDVEMLIGARTNGDVLCVDFFDKYGIPVEIATDDGSVGQRGQVTQLLKERLRTIGERKRSNIVFATERQEERSQNASGFRNDVVVYACGPWPMLRAVARLCSDFQVPCQVSMEENMPCGIGVCNGCVVPMLNGDNEYSMYRRTCIEGPPMWAHQIKW